jgi:3-deoxy-manno-octulosonate cytidylyltransferase (CMP-KDO synthetase)
MAQKKTLGVIPARFASTRFPGKPLIDLGGKTMIQRVFEQAKQAKELDYVVVATDHQGIFDHVHEIGGKAIMTSPDHQTGTDRCAEVARFFPEYAHIVNIQGDEPFIEPSQIDFLILRLRQILHPIATLVLPLSDAKLIQSANTVKALLRGDEAIYFSRQAIPFVRGAEPETWPQHTQYYQHIGLYGFQADVLQALTVLPTGTWERAENLEQLRWLEAGYRIGIGITDHATIGIDTPEDVERSLVAFEQKSQSAVVKR